MARTTKYLVAYLLGNAVQVLLHTVADFNYMRRPILFCISAGVIVFALVLFGVAIIKGETKPRHYSEYVEGNPDV